MPYIITVKQVVPQELRTPGLMDAIESEIYRQTIDENDFNLRTFIVALNPAPARTRKPRQAKGAT